MNLYTIFYIGPESRTNHFALPPQRNHNHVRKVTHTYQIIHILPRKENTEGKYTPSYDPFDRYIKMDIFFIPRTSAHDIPSRSTSSL